MRRVIRKTKMFHMNGESGRQDYNTLRKRTDTRIINEKDHWEQGQLRRFVEYDQTVHDSPSDVDLEKTNGIPSKAGQSRPDIFNDDDEELDSDNNILDDSENDSNNNNENKSLPPS